MSLVDTKKNSGYFREILPCLVFITTNVITIGTSEGIEFCTITLELHEAGFIVTCSCESTRVRDCSVFINR